MARIALDGITFAYSPNAPVLDDFALDIATGEAHALLGPSGCGKSTLLNLLSGLLRPQRGRVLFDGVDVTRRAPSNRNIAQVFQFPVLYPALSVRRNLEFPLVNRGAAPATIRARVETVAALLGLAGILERKPRSLSSYDKQKVALARALVRTDVAAVLLDEPLTAVEPAAKWRLRRALKDVQRELGLTMVYVTHDQLEALTFAERVTVLDRGRVLQTGTPEALVNDPAHTFVARFIGNPGMNLLPVVVAMPLCPSPPDAQDEVGFLPDAGRVTLSPRERAVKVRIEETRVHGTRGGSPWGLVTARLDGVVVRTKQPIDVAPGEGWLSVEPTALRHFRDGVRVHA